MKAPLRGRADDKMHKIVGLALVVDNRSAGQNLVFRYPAASPLSTETHQQTDTPVQKSMFYGLQPQVFAKLFRPKAKMCDQSVELTIDELSYVFYPCTTSASHNNGTEESDMTLFR